MNDQDRRAVDKEESPFDSSMQNLQANSAQPLTGNCSVARQSLR